MPFVENLGNLGSSLDAQYGSSPSANSNAPTLLQPAGAPFVYTPGSAGNYVAVPHNPSLSILGQPGTGFLSLPGVTGNYALTPDNAALDITGDIDIKVYARLNDWTPTAQSALAGKFVQSGSQYSYLFVVDTNGKLALIWSANGSTALQTDSSVATGFSDGSTKWVRATMDVDNGSSQRVTKFYTSDDGTTWTQLGNTITASGATSIFDGTAPLEIGSARLGTTTLLNGTIHRVIIQSAYDTTDNTSNVVFDADFTSQPLGTRSFTEATGKLVSLVGAAANIVDGTTYGYLPGVADSYFSTPDSAALDVVGDLDLRAQVALDDWTPATANCVIAKWGGGATRSYQFTVLTGGELVLYWTTDGTGTTQQTAQSTVPTGISNGDTRWVRATLDVNNGSGGYDVKFFTSTDGSSWTQLGATVTGGATTSIAATTSALHIGITTSLGSVAAGKIYRAQVFNGIAGTKVFDADFTRQLQFNSNIAVAGQTFTEAHGAVVTANGSARVERERDLEIVARVALEQWSGSGADQTIVSKWGADGARAYELVAQTGGTLALRWTPTGNNAQTVTVSSAAHSIPNEAFRWVKATLDIQSNGYQVRFYTAPDAATPVWTELTPAPAFVVGATSIFPATAPVGIGGSEGGTVRMLTGKVRDVTVDNGINGPAVLDIDFTQELTTGSEIVLTDDASTVIPSAEQVLPNLGWAGAVGNARFGSAALPNSNDPALLDHTGTNYLYLPGSGGNGLLAQDAPALDVTGDLDLRCWVTLDDWTPAAISTFIAKYGGSPNNSFLFTVNTTGNLVLNWSANGTAVSTATSTVPTGLADGTSKWVRVTLDVDNGASGNTATFFLSDDGITWVQLGAPVTAAGTTSIFNSTSSVQVGVYGTSSSPTAGRFHRAQILNGIGGTVVYDADLSQVNTGAALAAPLTGTVATDLNASYVSNLGTLGLAAPGRPGSGTGVDTNDPIWLEHTGTNYLYLPGVADNVMVLPAITGTVNTISFTIRMNWNSATNTYQVPLSRGTAGVPGLVIYANYANVAPRVWWRDGSNNSQDSDYITPLLPSGMGWRRFTVDASGANTVITIETAPDQATEPSSWTLHGTKTVTGATGITLPNVSGIVGQWSGTYAMTGSVYAFIERHNGSIVTRFDPANITAGSNTSVTLTTGGTGTINRSTSGRKSVAVVRPTWLFGTDDYMEFPDQPELNFGASDSFTVLAVTREWDTRSLSAIISKKDGYPDTDRGWVLYDSGQPYLRIADGVTRTEAVGGASPTFGTVVGVRDTTTDTVTVYMNGVAGTPVNDVTTGTLSNTSALRIGRLSGAGTSYADMEFFGAAVFRRALSAAEITTLNDYYVNGGSVAAAEALLATAVLWVDASKSRAQAAIVRATSGRKAVAVTRPTLLFGTDDYLEIADDPAGLFDFGATDSFTVLAAVRQWGTPTSAIVAKAVGTSTTDTGWSLYTVSGSAFSRISDGTNGALASRVMSLSGTLTVAAGIRNTASDNLTVYTASTAGTPATDASTTTLANAEVLRVGRLSGAGTSYAEMEFFGAAIFRRALTQSEISLISGYYQTGANQVAAETLLSTAVLWLDPRYRSVAQINRTSTGRKSVACVDCVWLLGTDDYFEIPSDDTFNLTADEDGTWLILSRQFPIMANSDTLWAKSATTLPTTQGWAISNRVSGDARSVEARMGDGSSSAQTFGPVTAQAAEVASVLVRQNGTLTLWTDGIAGTPVADPTGNLSNSNVVRIGRLSSSGTEYLDGEIRAAAFWRRALAPAEIAVVLNYYGV